jgi:AraC-like DNA-binding protein
MTMKASCSVRVVRPFLRLASARDDYRDLVPEDFWSANTDARVSLDATEAMLGGAVERLGEQHLGLQLGHSMRLGDGGAFDFAVRSAATVRDAIEVASRYSPLHSDSFRVWFETWRSYAVIRLYDQTHKTAACADFAMSAFYKLHVSESLPPDSPVECWFPYPAPRDTTAYERAFGGSGLRFGAPFFGLVFDRADAKAPMPAADPVIHRAICDRVDLLLASLSEWHATTARVRLFIDREIRNTSCATAASVARALGLSRRTLGRRLEAEGTSFSDELDSARRELGLAYVRDSEIPLKEISYSLGFSHVESFHRAFKRWSGVTPQSYRRQARLVSGGTTRETSPTIDATEPPRPGA